MHLICCKRDDTQDTFSVFTRLNDVTNSQPMESFHSMLDGIGTAVKGSTSKKQKGKYIYIYICYFVSVIFFFFDRTLFLLFGTKRKSLSFPSSILESIAKYSPKFFTTKYIVQLLKSS